MERAMSALHSRPLRWRVTRHRVPERSRRSRRRYVLVPSSRRSAAHRLAKSPLSVIAERALSLSPRSRTFQHAFHPHQPRVSRPFPQCTLHRSTRYPRVTRRIVGVGNPQEVTSVVVVAHVLQWLTCLQDSHNISRDVMPASHLGNGELPAESEHVAANVLV